MTPDQEPDDLGGVRVGAREIYDELIAMRGDLRAMAQHQEGDGQTLTDHEDRLRSLERWKHAVPVAMITSVGTLALTVAKGTGKG